MQKKALAAVRSCFHLFEGAGHKTPQSWEQNERKDFFAKVRAGS